MTKGSPAPAPGRPHRLAGSRQDIADVGTMRVCLAVPGLERPGAFGTARAWHGKGVVGRTGLLGFAGIRVRDAGGSGLAVA